MIRSIIKRKMKKIWISAAAVCLLTAGPGMNVLASEVNITPENETGDTKVDALVADSQVPTYIVNVPAVIDFGTLRIPSAAEDDFVEQVFGVKVSNVFNLKPTDYIAVRVKDTANDKDFKLTYHSDSGKTLPYDMQTVGGVSIKGNNYDPQGGYQLFTTNKDTDKPKFQLVFNQKELFEKDKGWAGAYEGSLTFYAGIVSTP